jgi:hypothetical protein
MTPLCLTRIALRQFRSFSTLDVELAPRRDAAQLSAAIKVLAGDLDLRRRLSSAAQRLAAERHDGTIVRDRFQTALAQAAQ